MGRFSFLSKVAFIFNTCFLICFGIRYLPNFETIIPWTVVKNTIIILGYLAIFLNGPLNVARFYYFIRRRPVNVPHWLSIFNFAVLLLMIVYFFSSL